MTIVTKDTVLIACEFSGVVRNAFIRLGYDAISCDFLESELPGPHYKGDVRDLLKYEWRMIIAHPPCTYLCNSGVRWLKNNPDRVKLMRKASKFFKELLSSRSKYIAVENPIPHNYAVSEIGESYNQIIQPYNFGHRETKQTCLWLKNLPLLRPAKILTGKINNTMHTMSPGKNRSLDRSRTFPGIARAMASQWGLVAFS